MSMLVVTAVRFDDAGRQEAFLVGKVDPSVPKWVAEPSPYAVLDVVDLLVGGDKIATIFPTGRGNVPGPYLRAVTLANGLENVATEGEPVEGRGIDDLPRF